MAGGRLLLGGPQRVRLTSVKMIDSEISRVRLRDLARLGRSRAGSAAYGRCTGACASRGEPVTVTSSSGNGLAARPRAASPRPGAGDLSESII